MLLLSALCLQRFALNFLFFALRLFDDGNFFLPALIVGIQL